MRTLAATKPYMDEMTRVYTNQEESMEQYEINYVHKKAVQAAKTIFQQPPSLEESETLKSLREDYEGIGDQSCWRHQEKIDSHTNYFVLKGLSKAIEKDVVVLNTQGKRYVFRHCESVEDPDPIILGHDVHFKTFFSVALSNSPPKPSEKAPRLDAGSFTPTGPSSKLVTLAKMSPSPSYRSCMTPTVSSAVSRHLENNQKALAEKLLQEIKNHFPQFTMSTPALPDRNR